MTMYVIRPIRKKDLPNFVRFAITAGAGVTSLPKEPSLLRKKVERSMHSFACQPPSKDGLYIFVAEDTSTGELGGTCAINAKTTGSEHGHVFRVEQIEMPSSKLPIPSEMTVLHPIQRRAYASEIAGLYLLPKFRREGLGRLLSLSRFLFVANYPKHFHDTIIAEMRGHIEKNHYSPFWEAVGRKFLDLDFEELLRALAKDDSFISQVVPRIPIYAAVLPKKVQRIIGKVHPNTRKALEMLIHEGFRETGEVDIFAGGPKITCKSSGIRSVANSKLAVVESLAPVLPEDTTHYLVSNVRLDFRCTIAPIAWGEGAIITTEVAQALQIEPGDWIRYVSPK